MRPRRQQPTRLPVPGILQARTLEWIAISFSNAWKWSCSVVSDLATPWTAAYQAPPSMGFSRQEYWSGVPLSSPGKGREVNKDPPNNTRYVRDMGSILELGRSSGGGHSNSLQYSCLENPMNRGAWWATVLGSQSWALLKRLSMHAWMHMLVYL